MKLAFWTAGIFFDSGFCRPRANEPRKFEVAAIKLGAPDAYDTFVEFAPAGRVNLTNMTLKGMVGFAWNFQPFQVIGGPPWIDSTRYVVTAKSDGSPKSSEIPAMVQALLADRFRLAVHHGTQELPIYAFVLAKRDGKLGPRLTESKQGDCTPFDPSKARLQPGAARPRFCGTSVVSPNRLTAIGIPIADSNRQNRTNREFRYAPKPVPADNAGPSIFSTIQEQLGLKRESEKGPLDVLIVITLRSPWRIDG